MTQYGCDFTYETRLRFMAAGEVLESVIHNTAQKLGYEDVKAEQMKVVSSVVCG